MSAADPCSFAAVRACAIAILAGIVLQVADVSAGNGSVIDWRTVRCGETLLTDGDAFDVAHLFVALVGPEDALLAVERECEIPAAPAFAEPAPRIHAYAPNDRGGRRRSFEVGPFRVYVEPHEDDAAQAAFAARLATFAAGGAS